MKAVNVSFLVPIALVTLLIAPAYSQQSPSNNTPSSTSQTAAPSSNSTPPASSVDTPPQNSGSTESTSASPAGANSNSASAPTPQLDFSNLNDAFYLSPDDIDKAIRRGQDYAKNGKNFMDLSSAESVMPTGVKGEKGRSHESRVTCLSLDGLGIQALVYTDVNNYQTVDLHLPPTYKTSGVHYKFVVFHVVLISASSWRPGLFAPVTRNASADDVNITRFALTDDQGNVLGATAVDPSKSGGGSVTIGGVTPETTHVQGNTNGFSNGSAWDNQGDTAYGTGTYNSSTSYSITTYHQWTAQEPYYYAVYDVEFPLFDDKGEPLVPKTTKSLILHMVKPNGEEDATFDLHAPKI